MDKNKGPMASIESSTIMYVEKSAYDKLQQELDVSRAEIEQYVIAIAVKEVLIEDSQQQVKDYEDVLTFYDIQMNGGFKDRFPHHKTLHLKAREILNKWNKT